MANEMSVRFELFVRDVKAAADFYVRVLGFEQQNDSDRFIHIRNGSVKINLCDQTMLKEDHYFPQTLLQQRKGVGVEIVLETDDLDGLYQRVLDSGYQLESSMQEQSWGARDFRIADPDGYYLRITK